MSKNPTAGAALILAILATGCGSGAGSTTATVPDTTVPTSTVTAAKTGRYSNGDTDEAPTTTTAESNPESPSTTTTITKPEPPTTTGGGSSQTSTMGIESFSFVPNALSIHVGDTVRWSVTSGTHTTTSTGSWDSGSLATGQSFEFVFTQSGTYPLFCAIHPGMQATVTVQP